MRFWNPHCKYRAVCISDHLGCCAAEYNAIKALPPVRPHYHKVYLVVSGKPDNLLMGGPLQHDPLDIPEFP